MAGVYAAEQAARRDVEQSQREILRKLLRRGAKTTWGRAHGLTDSDSYVQFAAKVEAADYGVFRPLVERMVRGEADLLWPGTCRRFAQSSGTSGSKSKFIPVTAEALSRNHYAGAAYSLASYLRFHPESRVFGGENFILGGSFANEIRELPAGVKVGDLSATLIDRINPLVNLFRIPDKATALMADWTRKLPQLVEKSLHADVRSISGVPSWFLTVLKEVLKAAGAENIHQVWPNLEVFFHGGIAFGPYRGQYARITDPGRMHYWENYNASEGFFAVQERPDAPEMGLLMNAGVFYEFLDVADPAAEPVPAWKVAEGKVYELVITSSNGLWRYRIGDTVRIERTDPLLIVIAGRTRAFINAFGEEVMVCNTDAALREVCTATGAEVADYTAAPVYAGDRTRGRHQWLVEFVRMPDCSIGEFARQLDEALQRQNSDYQAKRSGNIFLDCLEVIPVRIGLFNSWLAATGKLGGQRKVPRLSNDRALMDRLLEMNSETSGLHFETTSTHSETYGIHSETSPYTTE